MKSPKLFFFFFFTDTFLTNFDMGELVDGWMDEMRGMDGWMDGRTDGGMDGGGGC